MTDINQPKPFESLEKDELIRLMRNYQKKVKYAFLIGLFVSGLCALALGLFIGVYLK